MNNKYTIELTEDEMIRFYANKIVEDALSDCSEFNYCLDMDRYNDNGFVEQHQKEILDRIDKDERVAEVYIDKRKEPYTFDMVFLLDYCPYYYENNELHPQIERTYLKMFIDKIKEIEEYIHIRTTRDIIRNFIDSYVESDDTLDFEDKDGIYYSLKEHICNTGFNENYIDKYEVYVTKDNVNELINLLENELKKTSKRAYEAITKISLDKVREMIDIFDSNKPFNENELNCFICEDNNMYLCIDNIFGEMTMEEFDNLDKCLDYIGRKDFDYANVIKQSNENQEEMEA